MHCISATYNHEPALRGGGEIKVKKSIIISQKQKKVYFKNPFLVIFYDPPCIPFPELD